MRTNNEILVEGYEALSEKLGLIDSEKFIAYIQREPFDYTEWQRKLLKNKSAVKISKEAMEFRKRNQ